MSYGKTRDEKLIKLWHGMKFRAEKYSRQIMPREDFTKFITENEALYDELYSAWEKSGFNTKLAPSIDRKDNCLGYVEGNLQLITFSENVIKGNDETDRKQYLKPSNKLPVKLEKDGQVLTFNTHKKACDFLGKARNAIHIAKKRNSATIDGWAFG